jgi:hypothetical protein
VLQIYSGSAPADDITFSYTLTNAGGVVLHGSGGPQLNNGENVTVSGTGAPNSTGMCPYSFSWDGTLYITTN